jgi:hypothetical protein
MIAFFIIFDIAILIFFDISRHYATSWLPLVAAIISSLFTGGHYIFFH